MNDSDKFGRNMVDCWLRRRGIGQAMQSAAIAYRDRKLTRRVTCAPTAKNSDTSKNAFNASHIDIPCDKWDAVWMRSYRVLFEIASHRSSVSRPSSFHKWSAQWLPAL